jgi:hypothetical protein
MMLEIKAANDRAIEARFGSSVAMSRIASLNALVRDSVRDPIPKPGRAPLLPAPLNSPPQRASSLAHSMRQLPASSECSHEKHDAPKVLRLDHLHRVITTNGDSCAAGG